MTIRLNSISFFSPPDNLFEPTLKCNLISFRYTSNDQYLHEENRIMCQGYIRCMDQDSISYTHHSWLRA